MSQPEKPQDGSGKEQVRRDGGGRFVKGQSGNRTGRPSAAVTISGGGRNAYQDLFAKLDGWAGQNTGIGVRGFDKGMDSEFQIDPISDQEARELYAGDDVCKRVANMPAREMYREGFELTVQDDTDAAKALTDALNAVDGISALIQAKQYERAYGGAAILPFLNDQQVDLRRPLNRKRIVELTHLHVIEPSELIPVRWYSSLENKKAGQPEIYQYIPITPGGATAGAAMQEIHESRLIIWRGEQVTKQLMPGCAQGWGYSAFMLMKSALRGFNVTYQSMTTLVADFAQAVIKMKNLAELVALGKVDEIKARMLMVEYCRSVARAVLIDAEEEYSRETTTVTGLPELADRIASRLAAAANMPLTLMMGQSPKGLGNEGDSDLHWWYNQIAGLQTDDTPKVKQLLELIQLDLDGPTKGKVLDYAITWRALWHPSDKEVAETRYTTMQTDKGYHEIGVLDQEDIASSRFGGDKYSMETTIDWEARAQAEADLVAAEEERTAEMAAAAAGTGTGAPGAGGTATVQATAMNGAQVSSMVEVVRAAIAGEIPRESAVAILTVAFPVSSEQAEKMLGPKNFEPTAPAPAPNPFGGGGPPSPPKPPAEDPPSPEDKPVPPPAKKPPPPPAGKPDPEAE